MNKSTKFIIGVVAFIALLGIYPLYMFKANFNEAEKNTISGNGDIQKEILSIRDFEEIEVVGDYEVILKQGDFKVETEVDSNLQEHLEISVKDNSLRLKIEKGIRIRSSQTPKVYITMPELRRAIILSSGSLKNEGIFTADHIEMQIMGSGDMDLNFECETMKASIMGSGDIELAGKGSFLEISLPGSGEVDAEEFFTENANVRIAGSGDAKVNATGHLDASISGSGSISYAGNPESVNKQINGSGDIHSL